MFKSLFHRKQTAAPSQALPWPQKLLTIFLVVVLLLGGFGYLVYALYVIQIRDYTTYQKAAAEQQLSDAVIPALRGSIYDATGEVLAKSTIVWNITTDPSQCDQSMVSELSREIANILDLSYESVYEKLSSTTSKYKVLATKVEKPVADEIQAYATDKNKEEERTVINIGVEQTSDREYPYGAFLASVLGFCNGSGEGIYGLENSYEETLAGVDGRSVTQQNAWGYELANDDADVHDAINGQNLTLSIDVNIQTTVEKYLSAAIEGNDVQDRGCAIVMNVNTGEILGMATEPSFDPNDPYTIYDAEAATQLDEVESDEEYNTLQGQLRESQWKNKCITELYYPGSVFKVVTAASALDSGLLTADSSFYCGGELPVADQTYHCAEEASHGMQNMAEALRNSCNLYFIQVGQTLGSSRFYDYFNAFGFTERTGVDLPHETIYMQYYDAEHLGASELASSAFGQAQKITPLQMCTALAACVNGGYLVTPHVVNSISDANGNITQTVGTTVKRQVVSEEVSAQIRSMMEYVVGHGQDGYAGKNAYVAGYAIGGKSGTSEKLDTEKRGDNDFEKVSSFAAILPVDDPEILVFVMLDDPRGIYDYASVIAAPVAGNIISEVAPYLSIEMDGSLDESQWINVPYCVDYTWSLAQVNLNKVGLAHTIIGPTEGDIVAQYPEAGTSVPVGATIYLYTQSSEYTNVNVPDVVGKQVAFARQMLEGTGLNAVITGDDEDVVISQSVESGQSVPMGTLVTLQTQAADAQPENESGEEGDEAQTPDAEAPQETQAPEEPAPEQE